MSPMVCNDFSPDTLGENPNVCMACMFHKLDHPLKALPVEDDPFEPVENNSFDPNLEDEDLTEGVVCPECDGPVNEEGSCMNPDCDLFEE